VRDTGLVRVTARGDYAVRAAVELAAADGDTRKVSELAAAQGIPPRFLENILLALRRAGLVQSRRGADGGFRLARPADQITLADVLRAVEGPLANVQGVAPDKVAYEGSALALRDVWVAVRASLRVVLERVTLAEVASGALPSEVQALIADPEAWRVHIPQG
jgi:Rrf2 family protein